MSRKCAFRWTTWLLLPVLLASSWLTVAHHHHPGSTGDGGEAAGGAGVAACACHHHASSASPMQVDSWRIPAEFSTVPTHCLICQVLATYVSAPAQLFAWIPAESVFSLTAVEQVGAFQPVPDFYCSRGPPSLI